jgi:hypothetical protein
MFQTAFEKMVFKVIIWALVLDGVVASERAYCTATDDVCHIQTKVTQRHVSSKTTTAWCYHPESSGNPDSSCTNHVGGGLGLGNFCVHLGENQNQCDSARPACCNNDFGSIMLPDRVELRKGWVVQRTHLRARW